MRYTVYLSSEAVKALDRIDWLLENQIREKLRKLENKPDTQGKIIEHMNGLRLEQAGGWHIFYSIYEKHRLVCVLTIRLFGD